MTNKALPETIFKLIHPPGTSEKGEICLLKVPLIHDFRAICFLVSAQKRAVLLFPSAQKRKKRREKVSKMQFHYTVSVLQR